MTATMKRNKSTSTWGKNLLAKLGRVGGALLFPIAVLPIAAILLRVGAQIPGNTEFSKIVGTLILKGGGIVFDNLAMVFCIGLAFGFTKDRRGEAAFTGFVAMTLLIAIMPVLVTAFYGQINFGTEKAPIMGFAGLFGGKFNAIVAANVLNGIFIGSFVAWTYNRFNDVELPKVLGFFSGRRLIPALGIIITMFLAIIWAIIFPWIGWVIYEISKGLSDATSPSQNLAKESGSAAAALLAKRAAISGVYGFINRLLIPFGLHHIPNTLFWFVLGSWPKVGGGTANGDIFIFLDGVAKDNPGGLFQSGFFPVMMFGLPALAAAFWFTADGKEQRRRVLALFGSAAVVSFLTGITEPIEFAFVYVAPFLYLIHAILTGIFCFITTMFGIQLGFGFSAGAIDYLLSINKSLQIIHDSGFTGARAFFANPGWIIPIGALCAVTYFFVGTFFIKKFDLSTPGRKDGVILTETDNTLVEANETPNTGLSSKAKAIVKAYGGWDNIVDFQNCSTRLRYRVKDASKVDEAALKKAGAFGVVKMNADTVHTIVGVEAEGLNAQISDHRGESLD